MTFEQLLISTGLYYQPETDVYVNSDPVCDELTHCYTQESPGEWLFVIEDEYGNIIEQKRFTE